jgi:hypothetical protein
VSENSSTSCAIKGRDGRSSWPIGEECGGGIDPVGDAASACRNATCNSCSARLGLTAATPLPRGHVRLIAKRRVAGGRSGGGHGGGMAAAAVRMNGPSPSQPFRRDQRGSRRGASWREPQPDRHKNHHRRRHPDPPRPQQLDREAAGGGSDGSGGRGGGMARAGERVKARRFVTPATDDTLFNKCVAGSSTDTMSGFLEHE